ncbi:MAG: VWA domain-containing protein, partial [Acidobacteria bacterium]
MKKNYQEHELTAFLLDELDDKRRDEIAEILKDSGSARQELEELRETMQGLCEAMAVEPAMTLSAEQREEIQAEFAKPQNLAPVSRPSSRTRFVRWAVPLAAAASLFVVFLLSWNVVVNRESLPHPTEQAAKLQQSELDKAQSLPKTADLAAGARESDPPARITDSKEEQSTPIGNEKAREKRAISDAVLAYKSAAVPSFKGKVTDSAGAPLPGAAVQVASDAAKPVESTLTDTRGQFAVPPLPEGAYTVRAALPGFKPSQVGPVNVEDGQTRQVQLALQAGGDGTIGALKEFSESARTSQEKLRSMSPTSPEQLRSMSPAPAKDPRGVSETFHLDGASGGGAGVIDRSKGEARFRIVPRSGIAPEEESFNTESYTYQADNEMTAVAKDPLSTFSIDVDTASYSNVRRFLREGRLPPPDAVRIEEMINYFPYDYEPPHDRSPFAVVTEVAQAPWALDHRLVRIALKGRELPPTERPDANLVFLLDVSGSMQPGVKLPLVKQAMRLLVEKLESSDRVAIVTYAGTSGLALPSTSGSNKERIL